MGGLCPAEVTTWPDVFGYTYSSCAQGLEMGQTGLSSSGSKPLTPPQRVEPLTHWISFLQPEQKASGGHFASTQSPVFFCVRFIEHLLWAGTSCGLALC